MFPESTDVSRDEKEGNIRTRGKTNYFPEGPYIKCFLIYLGFPLNNHIANKQTNKDGTTSINAG